MDREETKKAIKVMQEWVKGEAIEFKDKHNNNYWRQISTVEWVWDLDRTDVRIKPKKPRTSALFFECGDKHSVPVIELTDEVKKALEKAGISYAD